MNMKALRADPLGYRITRMARLPLVLVKAAGCRVTGKGKKEDAGCPED